MLKKLDYKAYIHNVSLDPALVNSHLMEQRQHFQIKEPCSFFKIKKFHFVISHLKMKLTCRHSSFPGPPLLKLFVSSPNKRSPGSGLFPVSIQQYQGF